MTPRKPGSEQMKIKITIETDKLTTARLFAILTASANVNTDEQVLAQSKVHMETNRRCDAGQYRAIERWTPAVSRRVARAKR